MIETLKFTRPNDDESTLDYVNFTPLLQLVTPDNILGVFASLLIERCPGNFFFFLRFDKRKEHAANDMCHLFIGELYL